MAKAGVSFEKKNPVTSLMSDVATRTPQQDILGEKVMSAALEIKTTVDRTEEIILLVREVEKQLDTVISIGVGTRCDENGEENVVAPILERLGSRARPCTCSRHAEPPECPRAVWQWRISASIMRCSAKRYRRNTSRAAPTG
jgi:hypothetical protein